MTSVYVSSLCLLLCTHYLPCVDFSYQLVYTHTQCSAQVAVCSGVPHAGRIVGGLAR